MALTCYYWFSSSMAALKSATVAGSTSLESSRGWTCAATADVRVHQAAASWIAIAGILKCSLGRLPNPGTTSLVCCWYVWVCACGSRGIPPVHPTLTLIPVIQSTWNHHQQ